MPIYLKLYESYACKLVWSDKKGKDKNDKDKNALIHLAMKGTSSERLKIVEKLIEKKANLNLQNNKKGVFDISL